MFPLRVCSLLFFMASQSFLLWFFLILSFYSSSCGNPPVLYCAITFGHEFYDRKALEDNSNQNSNSTVFKIYVVVLAIYAGVQFFVSFLLRFPACHRLTNRCDSWPVVRFIKWMHQVLYFYQIFLKDDHSLLPFDWDVLVIILLSFFVLRNTITLAGACMRELSTSSSNPFIFTALCITI